jgi:hypothetical protein
MAIGARLVAPGVAPERAGHRQYDWRLGQARRVAASLDHRAAQVAPAQLAQAVVVGGVVVHARREIRQVAAHEVQLEVVPRPRPARRPELHHPPRLRIHPPIQKPITKPSQPRQRGQINQATLRYRARASTSIRARGSGIIAATGRLSGCRGVSAAADELSSSSGVSGWMG